VNLWETVTYVLCIRLPQGQWKVWEQTSSLTDGLLKLRIRQQNDALLPLGDRRDWRLIEKRTIVKEVLA